MNKDELAKWLWNMLKSCYPLYYPSNPQFIYWYYNEQFTRKLKLCKLNNEKIIITGKSKGDFVFEQDIVREILYFNNDNVWHYFKKKMKTTDDQIKTMMNDILNDSIKFQGYESDNTPNYDMLLLYYNTKFKLYYE